MFVRVLLAALAAFAMVGSAAGQACSSGFTTETCTSTELTAINGQGGQATLSLIFSYCAPNQAGGLAYGTGTIVNFVSGNIAYTTGTGGVSTGVGISALTGSITTVAPGTYPLPGTNTPTTAQAPIYSFLDAANPPNKATITVNGVAYPITSNVPVIQYGVSTQVLGVPSNLQSFTDVRQDACGAVRGDPLFSGFRGQQFYVGGEDGQVMNMISTFNLQLNGRFVNLEEGAAITPAEQEKQRLLSLVRNQEQPEVRAFPRTTAWSHPGNYFGEVGVALLDDNRVYVKAGSFATGFSKVALNGRPLAVSSDFVVLGSGANTTYIQRVSAHEVMIRTVNVEFTLTNSDNFLNVENVHLERGFNKHNKFDGLMGKTVDSKWSWNAEDEKASIVESNDLFAKTTMEA